MDSVPTVVQVERSIRILGLIGCSQNFFELHVSVWLSWSLGRQSELEETALATARVGGVQEKVWLGHVSAPVEQHVPRKVRHGVRVYSLNRYLAVGGGGGGGGLLSGPLSF